MKILGQKRNLKKEDLSGNFFAEKYFYVKKKCVMADADICRGDLWLVKRFYLCEVCANYYKNLDNSTV